MKLQTETTSVELQHVISHELERLARVAKDIETHLEDALHSKTLRETTVTGIQQIDEIAQILEQLSALIGRASRFHPLSSSASEKLIAEVPLLSLQHRLQGIGPEPFTPHNTDVDFF